MIPLSRQILPRSQLLTMYHLLTILTLFLLMIISSSTSFAGYSHGRNAYLKGDYSTALKEWIPAAEEGSVYAQYSLGIMYGNGQGTPQDYKAAFKWCTLAAEQGHAGAQYNLGIMYAIGQGVPQDYKAAFKWYTLSAEQHNANAQNNLGAMYAQGVGVPQNYFRAYMYFYMSTVNKSEAGAENRRKLSRKLTSAQIEKAQIQAIIEIKICC